MTGLQSFIGQYNKLVKKFSEGLKQCSSNFEKDMLSSMRVDPYGKKGSESTELEFSTTSIAITSVRSGVDVLA